MTKFYANVIVSFIWFVLFSLVIMNNMGGMIVSMLFIIFILSISENFSNLFIKGIKLKKIFSLILSIIIVSLVSYSLFKSIQFMWIDFNAMINQSEVLIIEKLRALGLSESITTIKDAYVIIFDYLKSNLSVIAFSAGLLLKVILGAILGILFHFSSFNYKENNNAWEHVMFKIANHCSTLNSSFRDIMSIQVKIALMNTTIVAFLALAITYVFYGQFLPYWYVIIPLAAILSLIPVAGNVALNLIVFLATIQLSVEFSIAGFLIFLLMHKLEFFVIGNQMEQKIGIVLVIVLLSMLIGEALFHSMSGVFLGLIILVTISRLLKQTKII